MKQTHTKEDYNNLQRNKRHSAPINSGSSAVPFATAVTPTPPPPNPTEIIYDGIRWCSVLLNASRCTARRHFLFLVPNVAAASVGAFVNFHENLQTMKNILCTHISVRVRRA